MAGPGGGPSRRSHTKSRKGCKTCKRRHIRCDETFPQCRNCTKHQVRCDYMDSPTAAGEGSPKLPQQANLLWTSEIDKAVEAWRHSGEFPFPELNVFVQPQWQAFSKTDLRLLYHLSSIASEMHRNRTLKLTLWTDLMPKFLSTAASHPFVMHSILSFSAAHLAWISQSTETRNLAFTHANIALKGLQEAINVFPRSNSDAVLASSMLLSWTSTDWRGWSSLMTSTRTAIAQIQATREESLYTEYITENGLLKLQSFPNSSTYPVSSETRREQLSSLQHIHSSLQRLQPFLGVGGQETRWVEQLKGYIDRLRNSSPPQSAEEQFSQLYALRKWLFWVPITLLSPRKGDVFMLLVLAHFYAAALTLEPMFPDIGAAFCANMALPPLEEIIRVINTVQATQSYTHGVQEAQQLMEFPREAATSYRSRREWVRRQSEEIQVLQQTPYGLDTLNLELGNHIEQFSYGASLSPAFAPTPLHLSPTTMVSGPGPRSPYLEVPQTGIDGHSYSSASYSSASYSSAGSVYSTPLGSPAVPLPPFSQEENVFNFSLPMGYPGGFVASPPTIWT